MFFFSFVIRVIVVRLFVSVDVDMIKHLKKKKIVIFFYLSNVFEFLYTCIRRTCNFSSLDYNIYVVLCFYFKVDV